MGAYRDEQTFAMMDSEQHGAQNGRRMKLASISAGLEVDPEVLDGLGNELDLVKRVERLEVIARSVAALLSESSEALSVVRDGNPSDVAEFIIADQLPPVEVDNSWMFIGSKRHYQLERSTDGGVLVNSDVWGGGMQGGYTFGEPFPLTTEWISERLMTRGVERDSDFCEQVVTEVTAQLTSGGESIG